MDTSRAFKLCKRIREKTGESVSIQHNIWVFATKHHQMYYRLTYFTDTNTCKAEDFTKWHKLETFCKEKWDV